MNLLRTINRSGLHFAKSPSEKRGVLLSNQISLILTGLSFVLFITYYYWYGWNFVTLAIPVASIVSLFPILLNAKGFNTISRIWVCLFIPVLAMIVSVYAKIIYFKDQEELDLFHLSFYYTGKLYFPVYIVFIKRK